MNTYNKALSMGKIKKLDFTGGTETGKIVAA